MTDSEYYQLLQDAVKAGELFSQDDLEEYARNYWSGQDVEA